MFLKKHKALDVAGKAFMDSIPGASKAEKMPSIGVPKNWGEKLIKEAVNSTAPMKWGKKK